MLFEMRTERNSCARNITLDWIGAQSQKGCSLMLIKI